MPSIVALPNFPGARRAVTRNIEWFTSGPLHEIGPAKGGRFSFRRLFSRGGSQAERKLLVEEVVPAAKSVPSGVRPSATQVGDDVVRAVNSPVPTAPFAGRAGSRQFPTQFVVKSAVYAGAATAAFTYGPKFLENVGDSANQATADAGQVIPNVLDPLAGSLANLLAGIGVGAGTGVGAGVASSLEGVGRGVKSLAVPLLLLGGGFLVFTALTKK